MHLAEAEQLQETPEISISVDLSDRQRQMIESEAITLWVGAGTKTGKTMAARIWIADGILKGEPCAWVGPWSAKTYEAYLGIKEILRVPSELGLVKCNDSTMRITCVNGGYMWPYTGDNPDAIFGSGAKRVVIDEASRQTEKSYYAAFTTISATGGQIKCMFNLDHGAQNWAIANLVRVKGMSPEERAKEREDYMLFPTLGEGFVDPSFIAFAKRVYPRVMFDALFNAIIPESDLSVFRNLADIFMGRKRPEGPEPMHSYIAGVDVARKKDWTVINIFDTTYQQFVDKRRFHHISWTEQYKKCSELYKQWRCTKAWVDATGLGDPVEEELRKLGMRVEPFIFTEKSKEDLISEFIIACDAKAFTVCEDGRFENLRDELTQFRTELSGKRKDKVRYAVPQNQSDDDAFSAMLAWYGYRKGKHGPIMFESVGSSTGNGSF